MNPDSRRILHICGGPGAAVTLDGPALRVEHAERAPVWMPVQRISTLQLEGSVAIGPLVLSTVAAAGCAVRILDNAGNPLADLTPRFEERQDVAAQLDLLLQQPDWRQSYQRWRLRQSVWDGARAIGRRIAVSELARLARPGTMGLVELAAKPAAIAIFRAATPWLLLDIAHLLATQGWPWERSRQPRPGPNPYRDVAVATRWELVRLLRRDKSVSPDCGAKWYARHRAPLLAKGRAGLDAFRRWLADRTNSS